jgi:signal transduction histidine kinase
MKSFSISARLTIAFCLLIALLAAIGGMALNRTQRVNEDLNDLVKHRWAKVQLSRQALAFSAANNRITLQVFLMTNKDDIDPLLAQRAQNTENISGLVKQIERDLESGRERDLLTAVKEARTPYVESYKRALKLQLQDQRYDEARLAMVQVTLPLLIHYHAAWNSFVQFQSDQMDESARLAEVRYLATRKQMWLLIVLAVISATVIMVLVTRRIAAGVAARQRAEEALRQAHDELEIRVEQRTTALSQSNQNLRDEIVERRKAEAERVKAEAERDAVEVQLHQAQKLEAVGQLAAGIAHEINTPTQFVGDNTRFVQQSFQTIQETCRLYTEMLQAAKTNSVTPELVTRIEKAAVAGDLDFLFKEIPDAISQTLEGVERITKIVRAMKEFSHPGSREKVAADLNKAIESTVIVASSEWKYVADLKLKLDPQLPLAVCFLGEFNQAILNLVVNAAHAIGDVVKQKPGTKGEITIRTRRDGDLAEVRVSDTGTGIPEKIRPRIFEPFFTTKDVGRGTGQGLSVVYGTIVKRHGGTVTFETEVGRGTSFIIRLPFKFPEVSSQPRSQA